MLSSYLTNSSVSRYHRIAINVELTILEKNLLRNALKLDAWKKTGYLCFLFRIDISIGSRDLRFKAKRLAGEA